MSLVRWFRKNNKKIMAVVVIVIMIGFIGGGYLRELSRRRIGTKKAIGYYGDNKEITNRDLNLARQELEILRILNADVILRSQDLRGIFLSELLFAERGTSSVMVNSLKRFIASQSFRITDKQIYNIYNRSVLNDIYWILLKKEAAQAGILMSDGNAKAILGRMIPLIFKGASYAQLIDSLIKRGVSEEQVQSTFAQMLSVLEYARIVCSSEDLTEAQIRQLVSLEEETVDVEFVKFDSSVFADRQKEPAQLQISENFEKYKNTFAGQINFDNPYGFGYKLNDMVRLEYVAAVLEDVSRIVPKPTSQQCQDYYQNNIESFKEQKLFDPNDPNLGFTERVKSYGEVAKGISNALFYERLNLKAEMIMKEAKSLTEAEYGDNDASKLSSEELKQFAGDYGDIAKQLTEKYQIPVHAGRTGLLDALEIQSDKYLGTLFLKSSSSESSPISLTRLLFAIEEIGSSELGPFDVAEPKMYENIGPLDDISGTIIALVRIVEAVPACEPQNLEQTIGKETLRLEQSWDSEPEEPYSVKDQIVEDMKRLAAMDMTKEKSEEFIEMAEKYGWDEALKRFNSFYKQDKENEPNTFELVSLANQSRVTNQRVEVFKARSQGNPLGHFAVNNFIRKAETIDKIYSLIPPDSNTIENLPVVMEFGPDMSYYCLKNVTINRIDQEQYDKVKVRRVFKESDIQVQNLAVIHFNPENIIKRMNFRPIVEGEKTADANTPLDRQDKEVP